MLVFSALAVCVASNGAYAQDNYKIQVYGSDTVAPKTTMVEMHSNFTVDGFKSAPRSRYQADGEFPTDYAEHQTVEITQGLTPWAEVGFYIFTTERSGQGIQWVGDHIRPRVRAPDSWHLPVGLSISNEIGYQRAFPVQGSVSCGVLPERAARQKGRAASQFASGLGPTISAGACSMIQPCNTCLVQRKGWRRLSILPRPTVAVVACVRETPHLGESLSVSYHVRDSGTNAIYATRIDRHTPSFGAPTRR